jgi:hypothetical protein
MRVSAFALCHTAWPSDGAVAASPRLALRRIGSLASVSVAFASVKVE